MIEYYKSQSVFSNLNANTVLSLKKGISTFCLNSEHDYFKTPIMVRFETFIKTF